MATETIASAMVRVFRALSALPVVLTLAACGRVRDYLPKGAPQSPDGREKWLRRGAEPVEQGPAIAGVPPVPPFQFFAAYYPRDIVLETAKSPWTMHEYAAVQVGERTLFIAKDSDRDGVQTITADLDRIETWLPEIPVPRVRGVVSVEDTSTGSLFEISLDYQNPLGARTSVEFRAPRDPPLEERRNGSTFDHSCQAVSALLDVRRRQLKQVEATVRYDGDEARIRKVVGAFPVKALLEQVQAGVAAASMSVSLDSTSADIIRPAPGTDWPTRSRETWIWSGQSGTGTLVYSAFGVTHRLEFAGGGLSRAHVEVDGLVEPGFSFELSAPLPDVTRPFQGTVQRHFVASVGGQPHGYGRVEARWESGQAVLELLPEEPYWFRNRPVQSRIDVQDDGRIVVESRIIDPKTGAARPVALVPSRH